MKIDNAVKQANSESNLKNYAFKILVGPSIMIQVVERMIHKRFDEFGEIHIKEEGMIRSLYFGNEKKQSSVFMPEPSVLILQYAQAMSVSLLFNPKPANILIIGHGAGCLLHFFQNAIPACKIDVVELRQAVIDLSHEYFLVPEVVKNTKIYQADAMDFVISAVDKQNKNYDMILIDVFDEWGPVSLIKDQRFISACQSLSSYQGVVCFNLWNRREDLFHQVFQHLSNLFSDNVLTLSLGKSDSNVIMFGFSNAFQTKQFQKIHPVAEAMQEKFGIDYPRFIKMIETQNFSLLKRLKGKFSV